MKNRITIAIVLSLLAVSIALGALFSLSRNHPAAAQTSETKTPEPTSAQIHPQIVQVAPESSTRNFDEVLLVLRSNETPFTYAFVLVAEPCFIVSGMPCGFTDKYPFSDELYAALFGNVVSWFPDGENGLIDYSGTILLLNYQQRKSQVYKSDLLKINSGLHPSPDMQWLVESFENGDPYLSDLILINISTGQMENLNILPDCFKEPVGWLNTTRFLFRCDKSEGKTPKKYRVYSAMFTIDIVTKQVEPFETDLDWINTGLVSLSPDGNSIVLAKRINEQTTTYIRNLKTGQEHALGIQSDLAQWTQDSLDLALYDYASGDIYITNRADSSLNKLYNVNPDLGFVDWTWLPNGQALLISHYTDSNTNETQLVSVSRTGETKVIDSIPTIFGYTVCGISPLPKIVR